METTQQQLGRPIIGVVLTPNKTEHFISKETAEMLLAAANEDTVELDDGTQLKVSMATEIIPLDEYKKQFPEKSHSYGMAPVQAVEFSLDEKDYATKFVKSKMVNKYFEPHFGLLDQIYNETKQNWEYERFIKWLRRRNIITSENKILADLAIEGDRVAFCYPAFMNMRAGIEEWQRRKQWEDEHTVSWDDLSKPGGMEAVMDAAPKSGLEKMIVGIKQFIAENPDAHNAKKTLVKMENKLKEKQNVGQTEAATEVQRAQTDEGI